MAKSRALKKEAQKAREQQKQPFASAFGKALHRARRALKQALPVTPRRRNAVYRKLIGGTDDKRECATPWDHGGQKPISDETLNQVMHFFERDDSSRQAPGRKDAINICNEEGQKEKRQARHLTMSVKEALHFSLQSTLRKGLGRVNLLTFDQNITVSEQAAPQCVYVQVP